MKKPILFYTSILLLTSQVSQAGVYDFAGGNCPSRGEWTRKALEATQDISKIIASLKNNPACQGLEGALVNLEAAAEELKTDEDDQNTETRIESLQSETDALQSAMKTTADGKALDPELVALEATRVMEGAALNSALQQKTESSSPVGTIASTLMTKKISLASILARLKGPTKKGLDLVTNVMKVIPQYDECLIGQPAQGLAIMSGVVKVAAAFSSSGEGVGDKLGNAIAGYMKMLQERKFTQVLRKQDETEFWLSMSCLIEGAAKNYCDAENAQEILQYSQDQYKASLKKNLSDRQSADYDNPLEGYYLLVRELPTISQWLQKVQFGVKPKLSTDASFKNKVWEDVVEQTKKINDLYGYFSEQMLFLKEQKTISAKRAHLISVLDHMVSKMGGGDGDYVAGSKFFTTSVPELYMPFYLIGRPEQVPSEMMEMKYGMGENWKNWMTNGGPNNGFISDFADPDKLAQIMESRMDTLIGEASDKASEYFRQRLIVDMPDLVNKTISSQYLPVQKAMRNVYNYLVRFEAKLKKSSSDPADLVMLPSVRDTQLRIKSFLDSYDDLKNLGKTMGVTSDAVELGNTLKSGSDKVIMMAFEKFNVLYQKDTFLTTRLTTFIERDFAKRIRSGLNMTAHQKDIMLIQQKNLMEKLIEVHGLNPVTADQDLASAQMVNKRNLESIEQLFSDNIYRMLAEIKAVATGTGAAGLQRMLNQKLEQQKDIYRSSLKYNPYYVTDPGKYASAWLLAGWGIKEAHPDLYSDPVSNKIMGGDTKFGSYQTVLAKICTQTLAFEHRADFVDLCQGTVLKSYYSKAGVKGLEVIYDHHINKSAANAIRKNKAFTSKNICAFNNFNIRNLVHMLKDQDKSMYNEIVAEEY